MYQVEIKRFSDAPVNYAEVIRYSGAKSGDEKLKEVKRTYTTKEAKPPIVKIVPKKVTTNIEWGVKINDKVVLEKNEERARGFLKGIRFLNNTCEARLVTVEIQEIKE